MPRGRSWRSCEGGHRFLAALGGQPSGPCPHMNSPHRMPYFVITPQAMRSPELPEGSVL
jgi:hypothetical protein